MKKDEIGEIALRDYKSVKYYPFNNDAAAPFILTSDPLGYLEAWIDSKHNAIQKDKAKMRDKLVKARYFTQLTKDFYSSSLTARMPSKGTLLYYSFINLVKVYLIMNDYDLETKTEHHGLSLPSTSETKLKLIPDSGSGISIFHEFAKTLGKPIDPSIGLNIDFSDLLRNMPEVHEIGYAMSLFGETKRKYLPVEINIWTNATRKKLYYTIAYEKKYDKLMKVTKFEQGILKSKLTKLEIEDDPRRNHFKSNYLGTYTNTSDTSWKMCYPKIIKDIEELNIIPMLTKQGYRFYLDVEPYRLHRLSSLLAFTYYIGTVARYRPTLNEIILKGPYQTIINEAIISCPSQFFYLMVGHITKQICAIPMSKLE